MKIKTFLCASLSLTTLVVDAQISKNNRPYSIKVLTGKNFKEILPFVVTQRILTFSQYPYLYVGDFAEEMSQFNIFIDAPDSAVAIAYHGETPVGLLTGCPLSYCSSSLTDKASRFTKIGVNPEKCYYLPEIIVLPEHRGNDLSRKLLGALESHAKKLGYEKGSLITESHEKHPLKPDSYKSLDSLWSHLQYKKTPLKVYLDWRTYQADGSAREQKHKLNFWTKEFQ